MFALFSFAPLNYTLIGVCMIASSLCVPFKFKSQFKIDLFEFTAQWLCLHFPFETRPFVRTDGARFYGKLSMCVSVKISGFSPSRFAFDAMKFMVQINQNIYYEQI